MSSSNIDKNSSPELCETIKDIGHSQIADAIKTSLYNLFKDDTDENYPQTLAHTLTNSIMKKLANEESFNSLEEDFLRSDKIKEYTIDERLVKLLTNYNGIEHNPYIISNDSGCYINTQAIIDRQPGSYNGEKINSIHKIRYLLNQPLGSLAEDYYTYYKNGLNNLTKLSGTLLTLYGLLMSEYYYPDGKASWQDALRKTIGSEKQGGLKGFGKDSLKQVSSLLEEITGSRYAFPKEYIKQYYTLQEDRPLK